jgi:rhomboid family GlyGly-CTERM serine protease
MAGLRATAKIRSQAPVCKAVPAKWRVFLALAVVAFIATYWPHALELFRLDRDLTFGGQAWRLLSGHLVHLNTPHLMLNLLALFLLCELVWRDLPWRHGVGLLLCAACGTSAALLAWHPDLAWYAGLSGSLHGLWAGCALHGLIARPQAAEQAALSWQARWPLHRRLCGIAMALLLLKLVLEFQFGPSQRTEQAIGGQVIAVAHAYGAFSGIVYLLMWRGGAWFWPAALLRFRLK